MAAKHKLKVPSLGELYRFESGTNTEGELVEWTPTNFADLPLEYSILGNNDRPLFESAATILETVSQPNTIESAILKFLADGQLAFRDHMLMIELDHVCFDNISDSGRFIATCTSEFDFHSPAFPATGCAGNGFWNLKFRLQQFDVVDYIRHESAYR